MLSSRLPARLRDVVLLPWAVFCVCLIRLLRPLVVIRLHYVFASRIGHFSGNTELYLCEREHGVNVPDRRYLDISYYLGKPANAQLALMWSRVLRIWPEWLFQLAARLNRRIPGGALHEAGANTQQDRDVHNLMEKTPPHLRFADEEEATGQAALRSMGVPEGAQFVCIIARDAAYLRSVSGDQSFDYHAYRDVDIRNYVQAAEALADQGYYVIRMGSVVAAPFVSSHPRVIDYASGLHRSDFLDIYLCAKCWFCLSCGTGLDGVAAIFRRPIAYVNVVPAGSWYTSMPESVAIFKHHWSVSEGRRLKLREVFDRGVGYSFRAADYTDRDITAIENSPEEIRALVVEMAARLLGTWKPAAGDEDLQQIFWTKYPIDGKTANGHSRHGLPRARYGAQFLRDNLDWLN